MLPFHLFLAAVLFPPPAAGQTKVLPSSHVRADSFACKETNWIAYSNAITAAASRQEHNCMTI
jgi:hypothetical protein